MIEPPNVQPSQYPHDHFSITPSDDETSLHNERERWSSLQEISNSSFPDINLATRESILSTLPADTMSQHPYSSSSPNDRITVNSLHIEDNVEPSGRELIDLTRTGADIGEEIRTGTRTVEPSPRHANQNLQQAEQGASPPVSLPPLTLTLVIQAIFAVVRCLLSLSFSFFWSTFTNFMPTRQLYTVSIILLTIHSMVEKLFEYLPFLLQSLTSYIGGEEILQEFHYGNYSGYQQAPEFAFVDKMFGGSVMHHDLIIFGNLLTFFHPGAYTVGKVARSVAESTTVSNGSEFEGGEGTASVDVTKLLEIPIVSIMLPTAILSIFLLLTMSVFLCVHVLFQILLGITSYITGTNRTLSTSGFSSSFLIWGILGMLLLETILPLMCLSIGIYLSFSVGGVVWSSFVGIICCFGILFKFSRHTMRRLQETQRNISVND